MDALGKFYTKIQPQIETFLREHHKDVPVSLQNDLYGLIKGLSLTCYNVYKKSILKEKHDLDIELPTTFSDPVERFKKQLTPCEVCGNTRVIHLCHIIPQHEGGNDSEDNILSLCANHHYLFDRHRLTEDEWNAINWNKRHAHSKEYALKVRFNRHKMTGNTTSLKLLNVSVAVRTLRSLIQKKFLY